MCPIRPLAGLAAAVLLLTGAVPAAPAQSILDRIKAETNAKIKARKDSTESRVVQAAGAAVDSASSKTGRGVNTVAGAVESVADTMINRTERGVAAVVPDMPGTPQEDMANVFMQALQAGRLELPELSFQPHSDQFTPQALQLLDPLARAIAMTPSVVLIEAHLAPGGDPASAQMVTQLRAAAIKNALIARGVMPDRLFAMGAGATRPPIDPSKPAERIEFARAQ